MEKISNQSDLDIISEKSDLDIISENELQINQNPISDLINWFNDIFNNNSRIDHNNQNNHHKINQIEQESLDEESSLKVTEFIRNNDLANNPSKKANNQLEETPNSVTYSNESSEIEEDKLEEIPNFATFRCSFCYGTELYQISEENSSQPNKIEDVKLNEEPAPKLVNNQKNLTLKKEQAIKSEKSSFNPFKNCIKILNQSFTNCFGNNKSSDEIIYDFSNKKISELEIKHPEINQINNIYKQQNFYESGPSTNNKQLELNQELENDDIIPLPSNSIKSIDSQPIFEELENKSISL